MQRGHQEILMISRKNYPTLVNKQWIPFAVLGMYKPHIHGYAEMNHSGMLLFNVEEDPENPSVIHILDGEEQEIAENFSKLTLREVDDNN